MLVAARDGQKKFARLLRLDRVADSGFSLTTIHQHDLVGLVWRDAALQGVLGRAHEAGVEKKADQ